MDETSLEVVLALIKEMEVTLLALKEVLSYIDNKEGREIMGRLIGEIEANLAAIKRRLTQ